MEESKDSTQRDLLVTFMVTRLHGILETYQLQVESGEAGRRAPMGYISSHGLLTR